MIQTRRSVLQLLGLAFPGLGLGLGLRLGRAQQGTAVAAASTGAIQNVSPPATGIPPSVLRYAAPTDMDHALDQMRVLREQLGNSVGDGLRLMVDANGSYSVVLLAQGNDAALDTLAKAQTDFFVGAGIKPTIHPPHTKLVSKDYTLAKEAIAAQKKYFQDAGVQRAERVWSAGLRVVSNVRFGVAARSFDEARTLFKTMAETLGSDSVKRLAVERSADGMYSVVYRSMGDAEACDQAMAQYHDVLEQLNVADAIVPEQDSNLVYNETAFLIDQEGPQKVSATEVRSVPGMQEALEKLVLGTRRQGERISFLVMDVSSGATLASYDASEARECASMVKPYVALALFTQLKRQGDSGPLRYDNAMRLLVERSLRESDNVATNTLMRLLGGPQSVQRILETEYPGMLKNTHIVEEIPPDERTYLNKSSAEDYGRMMVALRKHDFPRSSELLRIMALSIHSRLYWGAVAIPGGTLQYNKTGSTDQLTGDMALISARTLKGGRGDYFILMTVERDGQPKKVKGQKAAPRLSYHPFTKDAGARIRLFSSEAFRQLTPVYGFIPAAPPPKSPLREHIAPKHQRTHGQPDRHRR